MGECVISVRYIVSYLIFVAGLSTDAVTCHLIINIHPFPSNNNTYFVT